MPFTATAGGAKQVFPGPAPEPADLVQLIEEEGVTVSAGVPTVWLGIQEYAKQAEIDLSSLERIVVGGAAAPQSLIRWYDEHHDVEVTHAWGMTEMSPIGTVAHLKEGMGGLDYEEQLEKRGKQGLAVPGLEFKVLGDDGSEVPWNSAEQSSADHSSGQGPREDGEDFGELLVRGPWVTQEYYERPDANESDFDDGWLRTGDVVTVDEDGYVEIVDRTDDVIKSGGEWISSQELENAIMAHDDVAEAAVIGIDSERWGERPAAFVVPSGEADRETLSQELMAAIEADYPKWWRPDEVVFVESIPKTATGKFSKMTLRERYGDELSVEGKAPDEAAPESED
jgi:fatty-acyl-CoA synthase